MGPTWALLAPDVPHVDPMNLALRAIVDMYVRTPLSNWNVFLNKTNRNKIKRIHGLYAMQISMNTSDIFLNETTFQLDFDLKRDLERSLEHINFDNDHSVFCLISDNLIKVHEPNEASFHDNEIPWKTRLLCGETSSLPPRRPLVWIFDVFFVKCLKF